MLGSCFRTVIGRNNMGKKSVKPAGNKNTREWTAPIWVAVITGVVSLLLAIFAFPPFQKLFDPKPTTTPTVPPTLIVAATNSPVPEPTPTPTFTFTPTEALEPSPTFTQTPALPIGMQVKLTANQTSGRPPLTVKLDARDSYLRAENGEIFSCRKGACSYVWYVYLNGQEFIKPLETRGTFEYTFDKKGTYLISVYICHGAVSPICGSGSTPIIVQ